MQECAICKSVDNHPVFTAHEIQFGTGEAFRYFRCLRCGCLQIEACPDDMAPYYPPEYYSFSKVVPPPLCQVGRISRLKFRFSEYYNLTGRGIIGKILYRMRSEEERRLAPPVSGWLKLCSWDKSMRVLDIGCGVANYLHYLHEIGFRHLVGIDPFNPEDVIVDNRLKIYKRDLFRQDGQFDVILSSHSLEHMQDQHSAVEKMKSLLAPDGTIVIRIPVFSEYMFQEFGEFWQAWDPPRHFYLHSTDSINHLLAEHGLRIVDSVYDATQWQYGMSYYYKYQQGNMTALKELFNHKPVVDTWALEAIQFTEQLNQQRRSDCCSFIVRHV